MPLVFVHGVSNRDTPEYRDNQRARDAFLNEYVVQRLGLDRNSVSLHSPYWGDDGVKFRWENASLPESINSVDSMEKFGSGIDLTDLKVWADFVAPMELAAVDIVKVAQNSLVDAIDIVWGIALSAAETDEQSIALAKSCRTAFDYAADNPNPDWLTYANNDNVVDLLLYHIKNYNETSVVPVVKEQEKWESFGGAQLIDSLKEGTSRLLGLLPSMAGTAVTTFMRKTIHMEASMFLGDVFEYLTKRGENDKPGPIVATVLEAFRKAREQLSERDPKLIIIGHSLGGVIAYDILTYFDPSIEVDVFVSVGSQVAWFEEMSLYKHAPIAVNPPSERLVRPANIKRWLNVLDLNDVFSFRAESVFKEVTDFVYGTGYGLLQAHGGYFHRPSFYWRLGERLVQVP